MKTLYLKCGCSVTSQMLQPYMVVSVHHCQKHAHLHSDAKTLKEMADEIIQEGK